MINNIKLAAVVLGLFFSIGALAQTVTVDVSLNPVGDFVLTPSKVTGFATQNGDKVTAENVVCELKGLTTGVGVRDGHTKDKLEVAKFPEAKLIKAEGSGGKGTGTIEIRGIQKQVTGTYKIEGKNLIAKFPINLPDYGLTGIGFKGVGVEDEAIVNVNLPIKEASVAPVNAPAAAPAPAKKKI